MPIELDASTLVLLNVYIIMAFQLGFNWDKTNCNQTANLFQLGFIGFMAIRLFFHQLYHNRCTNKPAAIVFNFLFSGLLLAMGIFFGLRISGNPSDFYFDPVTYEGNQICFQNRIVFAAQIALIGLTVLKDLHFAFCGGQREDLDVKPS